MRDLQLKGFTAFCKGCKCINLIRLVKLKEKFGMLVHKNVV